MMQNFRSSNLNTFTNCLSKSTCHRLKLTDAEANGICCDNGQGWYNVYWNGKSSSFILIFFWCTKIFWSALLITNHLDFSKGQKLEHDPFNADIRDEQTITFGNCGDNQSRLLSIEPSSEPSSSPSSAPSTCPTIVPSIKPSSFLSCVPSSLS